MYTDGRLQQYMYTDGSYSSTCTLMAGYSSTCTLMTGYSSTCTLMVYDYPASIMLQHNGWYIWLCQGFFFLFGGDGGGRPPGQGST